MLVLIPPSEGKAPGGSGAPRRSAGQGSAGEQSAGEQSAGEGAFAELSSHRAELIARIDPGIDDLPTMAAIARYTGVLATAMSYPTLDGWQRRRADVSLVILSGLWGALEPTDPIPDYKLPIGTVVPGLGGLASWWRPRLSPLIDARAQGEVVWDLLPTAHAAAWDDSAMTYRARWRVRVLREAHDGSRTTVSHDNKSTKGHLARHLIVARPGSPRQLADLVLPGGYRVDTGNAEWSRRGGVVEIVQSWPGEQRA